MFSQFFEAAQADPLLYLGPGILFAGAIIAITIAARRLINDDDWAPRLPRLPPGTSRLRFKQETPDSSKLLSREQVIKHHSWRFVSLFSTQSFPVEGKWKYMDMDSGFWINWNG